MMTRALFRIAVPMVLLAGAMMLPPATADTPLPAKAVETVDPLDAVRLDDELAATLRVADPSDMIPILIYLEDRVHIAALEAEFRNKNLALKDRHERVVRELRRMAAETQTPLLQELYAAVGRNEVSDVHPFWIVNGIAARANPATILTLAARPDVYRIFADYRMELDAPVSMGEVQKGNGDYRAPEKGVEAIRAPEAWAAGFDGTGVLTATLDTGVDGNHEALADRWRGLDDRYSNNPEWAFFDPVSNKTFPFDSGSHGTHTMGTVLGGEPGRQVGVAPGAQWIHAAVIDRVSIEQTVRDAISAFEWLIDPDGDASTSWDVPTACSNSWRLVTGHGYPPCDETFWTYLDACETAGIVILFSAGNEGPGGESVGRPPDRASTEYMCFAVASVNANVDSWPISSYSSRGPSHCTEDGSEAIKPDIAAPGENVTSSVPGQGYASFSGTSMASPHTNGVAVLMRQANPDIPVDELKQIMFDTARDLGDEGDDNDYGHGMVDAYECAIRAYESAGARFRYPDGRPAIVDPRGATQMKVLVEAGPNDKPIPGSLKFFVDGGEGFTERTVEQTEDNNYIVSFGNVSCGRKARYYASVEGESGKTYLSPAGAPGNNYTADVYNGTGVAWSDNFETDQQWVRSHDRSVTGGRWQRGVPIDEADWFGPKTDGDGSGSAFVTGNDCCKLDVDGGTVYLRAPLLDVSLVIGMKFRYYYYEDGDSSNTDQIRFEMTHDLFDGYKPILTVRQSTNGWQSVEFTRQQLLDAGVNMKKTAWFRVRVTDGGPDSIVEGAIDGFELIGPTCDDSPPFQTADMNCDGSVSFEDIDPFVLALISQDDYEAAYPSCRYLNGDVNHDSVVDFGDIDGFVDCLINSGCE